MNMKCEPTPYADQATRLRELVGLSATEAGAGDDRPPLLAVGASCPGSGSTTVALQVSQALAQQGTRCALIDADREQPQIAQRLNVMSHGTLSDVLLGRLTLNEVAHPLCDECLVVPGGGDDVDALLTAPEAKARLDETWRRLARRVDLIVVDVGSRFSPWWEQCWRDADLALWTTLVDREAVLGTYAAIKLAHVSGVTGKASGLVVNRCGSPREAVDVHRRIAGSCQRFLGETLLQGPPLVDIDDRRSEADDDPARQRRRVESAVAPLAAWIERQLLAAVAASPRASDERAASVA